VQLAFGDLGSHSTTLACVRWHYTVRYHD
jgi:hypothetical protein